ncbi:DUF397 domain-containing protein [Streptomyces sp. NPDC056160]|uniref:DUF397 domain-containing protein n=1 Tax=Streptomyces sp. NPDC056160 TaxID=3345731 RepID=UPI0035DC7727
MQHTPELTAARWRRSSYSNTNGGECVEITGDFPGTVPVRDSKTPRGDIIIVPTGVWDAFVRSLRA